MVDRFTLGKTDTVDDCDQQDLLDCETHDECDMQLYMDILKRKADEVFDTDLYTTIPLRTLSEQNSLFKAFNPFSFDYTSHSNTWFDFTSDTDCDIVIAPDTIPLWDTFPALSELYDEAYKYIATHSGAFTGTTELVSTMIYNFANADDEPVYREAANYRAASTAELSTFMCVMSDTYRCAGRNKGDVNAGSNPFIYTILQGVGFTSGSGNTISLFNSSPVSSSYAVNNSSVGDGVMKRLIAYSSNGVSSPAYALYTKTNTIDWICLYRNGGVGAPASYPSKVRTLTTGNIIYKVSGTNLDRAYAYVNVDTTGGALTVEFSTTGAFAGEEATMTEEIDADPDFLYSASFSAANDVYIRLTLAGAAGTSCAVNRFAMVGIPESVVFLEDTDTVDESTSDSFTQQFEDLSEANMMKQEEMWDYMKTARATAVADQEEYFPQGNLMHTFGSFFIGSTKVSSTTFTYSASDDWYYHASPSYSLCSSAEVGTWGLDSAEVEVIYKTGAIDEGIQGGVQAVYNTRSTSRRELRFQDDDKVNQWLVLVDWDGGEGGNSVSYKLSYSTNETAASWTDVSTSTDSWASDGTSWVSRPVGSDIAVPLYFKMERTGYSMTNDAEVNADATICLAKKTYSSLSLETTVFATPHNKLYCGLLMNYYSYLSYVTAYYWDGSQYVEFNLFEITDISAYSTTKLKFTVSEQALRIKPILEGFVAINFNDTVAGRTA